MDLQIVLADNLQPDRTNRSRETHVVVNPDEFEEVFELAEPAKDFALYSHTS